MTNKIVFEGFDKDEYVHFLLVLIIAICYEGTWLCAEKVSWRIADEYLGNQEIYKSI